MESWRPYGPADVGAEVNSAMLASLLLAAAGQLDSHQRLSLTFEGGWGPEMAVRFLNSKGYSADWMSSAGEHVFSNATGSRAIELYNEFCTRFGYKATRHGVLYSIAPTFTMKMDQAASPREFWQKISKNSLVYKAYQNAIGLHLVERGWMIRACGYVLTPFIDKTYHYGECPEGTLLLEDRSKVFYQWYFVQGDVSRQLDFVFGATRLGSERKPMVDPFIGPRENWGCSVHVNQAMRVLLPIKRQHPDYFIALEPRKRRTK